MKNNLDENTQLENNNLEKQLELSTIKEYEKHNVPYETAQILLANEGWIQTEKQRYLFESLRKYDIKGAGNIMHNDSSIRESLLIDFVERARQQELDKIDVNIKKVFTNKLISEAQRYIDDHPDKIERSYQSIQNNKKDMYIPIAQEKQQVRSVIERDGHKKRLGLADMQNRVEHLYTRLCEQGDGTNHKIFMIINKNNILEVFFGNKLFPVINIELETDLGIAIANIISERYNNIESVKPKYTLDDKKIDTMQKILLSKAQSEIYDTNRLSNISEMLGLTHTQYKILEDELNGDEGMLRVGLTLHPEKGLKVDILNHQGSKTVHLDHIVSIPKIKTIIKEFEKGIENSKGDNQDFTLDADF